MANLQCLSCGAPDDGEAVMCKYCQRPVSAEAQQHAIPCPKCRTQCRWGKQKCVACQTWLVVSCVFCGSISPHNQQACMKCREPFAGAMERKQAASQQQQHHQQMQTMGTVGNIAASFLGAAAGAAVGSNWGHGHSDSYDYGHRSSYGGDNDTFVDATGEGPPVWSGGDESASTDYSGSSDYSGSTDYSSDDTSSSDSGSTDYSGDSGGDSGGSGGWEE